MIKAGLVLFFFCEMICSCCSAQKAFSLYLSPQYTHTISDITLGNNPWGMGIGLQAFLNNKSALNLALEITEDLYLEDDKVLRYSTSSGKPLESIDHVTNIFGGVSFRPIRQLSLSFNAGPSFVNGETLLGIKPSLNVYFPKNERWMARFSYIEIYNREEGQNFTSYSLSLGIRIF